jgi:hypothetical membrane protein
LAGSSTVSNSRLAAYCGIVSLSVVFALINVAIFLYRPGFVWTDNALSDLGVESSSAIVFNFGLIAGGILYFVFALGVLRFFQSQTIGKTGAFMLLLAAVFLCLIGVFPETAPDNLHFYVSVGFFVSVPIALLLLATAMLQSSQKRKLGAFTVLMAFVAVLPWIIPRPWKGVAIPELISALAAAVWSIVMIVVLIQEK